MTRPPSPLLRAVIPKDPLTGEPDPRGHYADGNLASVLNASFLKSVKQQRDRLQYRCRPFPTNPEPPVFEASTSASVPTKNAPSGNEVCRMDHQTLRTNTHGPTDGGASFGSNKRS